MYVKQFSVWLFNALVSQISYKINYSYLSSFWEIFIVILGEVANFVAYAFAPAVLVTPLGALSIIVRYFILVVYAVGLSAEMKVLFIFLFYPS